MWTDRTELLIGKDGLAKLENSHVAVVGIGGVGGYVCMMLARVGVGSITIIDFDKVDETNINRQVVANSKTIGKLKTDIMKDLISDINPNCKVFSYAERFCYDNAEKLFNSKFDYVIDAIDSVQDKVDLICYCKKHNINIISAMGAGNRLCIPNFKVVDIYKTSNDGLAKIMRKKLREKEIESLDVVVCDSQPILNKENRTIGSIAYFPAMCGCVLSAFVVNSILSNSK